ncbi:TonB-dependent receptor [Pedobacter sp. PLR]|uniref:TonB-dependent receptor n=1 Tax=Pedobacter sp. PLR TaxID=2994465 RepID=UPI002246C118|nr:TonB-dependent receptor [Pedobacter sp. PLR]MCX2453730.1 TonB-dependent receptor [Pedobacter sp. PLR]
MKLAFFTVLITCLNVSANVFSQEKVSIDVKSSSIENVLKAIEKQSHYHFVYSSNFVPTSKNINLTVKDGLVTDVLKQILRETDLKFSISNTGLVVISNPFASINDQVISGSVKDSAGLVMPGVTILVKGTKKGTSTDAQGKYTISVPERSVLIFSLVGYQTQERVVTAGTKTINVVMGERKNILDDVVVVGYGTSTKRKINSAVSSLSMEKVAPLPVQSINDAVAGRVPGLIVTSAAGSPGAKSSISIRGGGTPLYVIDNQVRSQNDFENLNPNDIESYSVLKDVGATALYGQQGANGIIMVTTKKGKDGKVDINYSFNQIFSSPTLFPKKLSSFENLSSINEVYRAEGRTQPISEAILALYKDQSQPFLYPNTDWQALTLKKHALEQRHDLSVTSGTKALTYYASGSYFKQGTNLKTDNNYNERYTYRLNTVSEFEKIHLKVTTGLDGYVENNVVPYSGTAGTYAGIYQHIQQKASKDLAMNEFGLPYSGTTDNPVVELSPLSGYNRNSSRIFNGILGLDYAAPFLPGLNLKATGSYNMWNSIGKLWSVSAPSYLLNSTVAIPGAAPSLSGTRGDGTNFNLQGFVTYNKAFGDHNIDFTGVYEQSKLTSNSLFASRRNYQIIYDQFNAGPTVDQEGSGSEYETARAGYVGRLSYNYKSKYFVDGTIRYDGNSAFPKDRRWGTFYSVSGGYIVSEENFMNSLKEKHILDYLKIRGSFGLVGQLGGSAVSNGTNLYAYVPGYSVNANAWAVNGNLVQGTSEPGSLASKNFSWYSDRERNIGLDLASLNSRLTASVDYFYKRTTGYVTADPKFSATLGIGLPPINFKEAALRREGAEFGLAWDDKVRDFSYKVGLNFTYFNELWERTTNEDENALKNPYTRISGTDQGFLQTGYNNLGFYGNNADLLMGARRISSVNVVAGDLIYADNNGDGKIDASDFRNIGSNTKPRINYGVTMDFGYKGFFLSAVVMGSGNRDRYLGPIIQGTSAQGILIYGFQQDYWRADNTDALFPRQVSSAGVNGGNNGAGSDFWVLKSKFLRLKYLQFGYDFKNSVLKNSPLKNCKLFFSGTNLLTSSKSMDYFIDPESDQNNENYPIQRTFSFGLNIGF